MLSQQCLADGQPILNVALEHGYQSASAFAAMFKRILATRRAIGKTVPRAGTEPQVVPLARRVVPLAAAACAVPSLTSHHHP